MMSSTGPGTISPPRVIIVMPAQWPRAVLRAALRELGYDAVGAFGLDDALRYPAIDPGRGPVRLMIVDSGALGETDETAVGGSLAPLGQRHVGAVVLLLASATAAVPSGPWDRVLRRPVSIGAITGAVQGLVPLAPNVAGPAD